MPGLPKRWHHGHSLLTGAFAGLAIYGYAPYVLFASGILLGLAATFLSIGLYRLGRTLLGAFEAWRERSRSEPQVRQS